MTRTRWTFKSPKPDWPRTLALAVAQGLGGFWSVTSVALSLRNPPPRTGLPVAWANRSGLCWDPFSAVETCELNLFWVPNRASLFRILSFSA